MKLSLKFHPMKNSQHMRMYEPKFQLICEAYQVLSNHQLRTIYEQYGEETLRTGI
jgi:DnaJ family protein B protein 4